MNRTPDLIEQLRAEIDAAPAAELPAIRGQLATLEAELLARLMTPRSADTSSEDRLIDADEAATLLGMSSRWVREHAAELPRVKLGRALRFSEKRLRALIKRRAYG